MEFYEAIVKEESRWNTVGRFVIFTLAKTNKEAEEYWPRLTKEKTRNS